ncbi:MAG: Imm21 family immunity protein [Gemmatimonadales bacterium]
MNPGSTQETTSNFWHSGWVASGGGPLLVLPTTLLVYWGGADPPEESTIPRTPGLCSDYDRACGVRGPFALIDVGPGTGLVLADEPNDTMWVRWAGDPRVYLVRWIQADDDAAMLRALEGLPGLNLQPTHGTLSIPPGHLVLFDSAMPGNDIVTPHESVNMEPGTYRVSRGLLQPDADTVAAVFCLARCD